MRYDSEHKERTRQRVLTEAAAAIRAHGPDGVGVATLMSKAGLTHGGFYAHFKSKDDLIAQAITFMFEQSRQRYKDDPDPKVALEQFIDMYVSTRHRDAPETGCPLPTLSGDLARMSASVRKRFTTGFENITKYISGYLKTMGQPTPDKLATSMVAEMIGAVALSRAIEDSAASDRILKTTRDSLKARLGLTKE